MHPTEFNLPTPFGHIGCLHWPHSPAAATIICLHGWLDNAASFMQLAPLLAAHFNVMALDLPGHGKSSHIGACEKRYHLVDQVDHVFDAIDYLGLDKVYLLGHSLGAGIATLMSAALPERIQKLVLIDALAPLVDDGNLTLQRWQKAYKARYRKPRPKRRFATVDEAIKRRAEHGDLEPCELHAIVTRNLLHNQAGYTWATDPRLRGATPLRMDRQQVQCLLAAIEQPTLAIMAASRASYLSPFIMRQDDLTFPHIDIKYMRGPHHLHIRDAPSVARYVIHFLQGVTND